VAWRPLLRAFHRDLGYLAVGLTLVYALSGLAVNHIADWDPNFTRYRSTHELKTALPQEDAAAARLVLDRLQIKRAPEQVYRYAPDQMEIQVEGRRLHVNPQTGRVVEDGQKPRPFLRLANWLHLNRGKRAWKVFADGYAVGLLLLAGTGLFMLPGKNGLKGRGAVLALLGAAIPILYVTLSGGPR
jgi:hypothetical protein